MSRRDNADVRCARCRMHDSLCICALMPRLVTRTRLALVIHRYEERKPTNTGRLATECLTNSEVFVRGHKAVPSAPFAWSADTEPLLLFPHPDATLLVPRAPTARPVTLIVPDGNWRQASKVRNRVPGLRDVACVTLPPDVPSIYRLRSEAHAHGLATVEAIARAMGILEGVEVRTALETVFRAMVERTLWSRGELVSAGVTGGLPPGAMSFFRELHGRREV
jgi:DTW domain-containing protein YfiP